MQHFYERRRLFIQVQRLNFEPVFPSKQHVNYATKQGKYYFPQNTEAVFD